MDHLALLIARPATRSHWGPYAIEGPRSPVAMLSLGEGEKFHIAFPEGAGLYEGHFRPRPKERYGPYGVLNATLSHQGSRLVGAYVPDTFWSWFSGPWRFLIPLSGTLYTFRFGWEGRFPVLRDGVRVGEIWFENFVPTYYIVLPEQVPPQVAIFFFALFVRHWLGS